MWIGIGIGIGRTRYGTGGTPASLLLDEYSGAAAAYSLRLLSSTYTGDAIEVRRASDNTTQDIGFVDGELDTASLEEFVNCEDVAPADYGSGAAAAYSLRYVSASYTGDVIQVRRSSDDTTQDFNPTEITDGTLATFCGAGDGFVTTWYDQSSNGNDATQTTASAQPQIVSSGSVLTLNSKPRISFDGSNDFFNHSLNIGSGYSLLLGVVKSLYNGSVSKGIYGITAPSNALMNGLISNANSTQWGLYTNAWKTSGYSIYNNQFLIQSYSDNSTTNPALNTLVTNNNVTNVSSTGRYGGDGSERRYIGNNFNNYFQGDMQELIAYNSDQSTNRKNIETNINSYYGIYTSDADGFVTTWYDQSGNGNDAAQSTAANQPQIVSGGSVILLNSKAGIDFQTDMYLTFPITWSRPTWIFSIHEVINAVGYAYDSTDTQRALLRTLDTVGNHRVNNGTSFDENSSPGIGQKLMTVVFDSTNSFIYNNGLQTASGNAGTSNPTGMTIGAAFTGAANTLAPHQEFVLYQSDQSSNRTGIETNINAQYQIYWDGSQTSLLDSYSGSAAAYSLRALSSAYTGPLVEVRRASDNATTDIYAKYNGSLNVDALESFCSGTNGFVTTWYDQSGNGNDATQTTAANQPQIVSSGSVILENGKPAIDFDGSNDNFRFYATFNSSFSGFAIATNDIIDRSDILRGGSSTAFLAGSADDNENWRIRTVSNNLSYATQDLNQHLHTWINDTTTSYAAIDGNTFTSTADTAINQSSIFIGGSSVSGGTFRWKGTMQEIILYPSDESSNRSGIETNINDFYSIY